MTNPVFALEPDIPRNVRVARWLLFRLLNGLHGGSLTLREGAQTFQFGTLPPRFTLRCRYLLRASTGAF